MSILAGAVVAVVQPQKQFTAAYDAEREANVNSFTKAMNNYHWNTGFMLKESAIPTGEENAIAICKEGVSDGDCTNNGGVSLAELVSSEYLAAIPQDESEGCAYYSGYTVYQDGSGRAAFLATHMGKLASDVSGTCDTLPDTTPPTVSTYSPTDNATDVAVNTNLVLTFSESVNQETGNITIKRTSDNSTIETIDVTSGQVTGDGTDTITINPDSDLATSTAFYVLIDVTAFDDLAGNSFAGIASTTTWNFTTAAAPDTTPPTVSTYSPTDNATDVAINANLILTFNEAVDPEAGAANDITIKKTSDNSTVETIDVQSAQVTGGGTTTITINPSSDLSYNTGYYVLIGTDAFDDSSSNSFAGISSSTTWNFTTTAAPDTTPPTVSTYSPTDNATDVAVDTNLILTFSEAVNQETGNITIKKTSDNSTIETIDVTSGQVAGDGTDTITINPASDLANSTAYYVLIDATAFDDLAGNSYAGIASTTTWNFTTVAAADTTPPTVSTYSPTDNATDVAVDTNLVLTFSEAVDPEAGADNDIVIKKTSDNSTVETIDAQSVQVTGGGTTTITINPSSDLDNNTSYYIQIGTDAFDDAAGNSFAGISSTTTWNFTTVAGGSVCGDASCDSGEACSMDCFTEQYCGDGVDNDQDGSTDCSDFDCSFNPLCGGGSSS